MAEPLRADGGFVPQSPEDHPEPEVLERFGRSEASPEECRAVVCHLLAGCRQCSYIANRLWKLGLEKKTSSEKALRQQLQRLSRQAPPKPTRRDAAMAALVKAAQEILLDIAKELQGIYKRLENMASALPPWPQGDEEGDDVVRELRAIIESVLNECLRSAIDDLRSAAFYPAEPPAEDDEEETAQ